MKKFAVSELRPGMRFSKPVYLDKENLFITSNTPVTDSDLDRLNKFGIEEVMTAGEVLQLDVQTDPNILETSIDDMIVNTIVEDELQPLKAVYDNLNRIKITFGNLFRESTQVIQDIFKKTLDEKPLEVTSAREIAERLTDFVRSNQNISYLILANNPYGYYLYNQIARDFLFFDSWKTSGVFQTEDDRSRHFLPTCGYRNVQGSCGDFGEK